MRLVSIRGGLLWLSLLAFMSVDVSYLNLLFGTTGRWIILAALLVAVLLRGHPFAGFQAGFGPVLAFYFLWCLSTTIWSEVPELSLMKAGALVVSSSTFLSAGRFWAANWQPHAPLSYLLPVMFLALFAGLLGSGFVTLGGPIALYQGLAANPNYLGILVAMALPLSLYWSYSTIAQNAKRGGGVASLMLLATLLFLLWQSASRAASLCALITITSFLFALRLSRMAIALALVGAIGFGGMIVIPEVRDSLADRLIYKGQLSAAGSIFFTRQEVWGESYEQAKKGGWLGGGYGVTIGDTDFSGGLTARNYGREKGNSQLAVWEETGLVGLALYAILIGLIVRELYSRFRFLPDADSKVQIALLAGLVIGLLAQSVFEAWWTAPASPESAVFWSTLGAISGIKSRAIPYRRRISQRAGRVAPLEQVAK